MTDALAAALLQQALWLSVAVVVLRVGRPLLLRLGAAPTYGAWALVPALMLTPWMPRPAAEWLPVGLGAVIVVQGPGQAATPAWTVGADLVWQTVWLAGTLLMIAMQAWRQWKLMRLGSRLPAGSSPALVGLWPARVVLPLDFEDRFNAEERELILAHEEVHRVRLDNLWNLLASLLLALHWWNPLAWWGARRMQADQELACDAAVLATRPGGRRAYVQALLSAHECLCRPAPIACRWQSAHPLLERIAMLDQPLRRNRRGVVLLAGVLATFTALAWIGQAPARAETAAPMLKLAITMTQRAGTRTRQVTLALAGPQGKAMRMAQAAEGGAGGTGGTGGTGGEGLPPIALDMTARLLDGNQVLVDMVLWEGEPLAATARPRMVIELGKPARIVRGGPGGQDSITLEIVPSLHP